MKKIVVAFLALTSLTAFANDCTLLVQERPTDDILKVLTEKGYKLTANTNLAKRGLEITEEEIEGEYKQGNYFSFCFGRYEKNKVTTTIKIRNLDKTDYIENDVIYTGNAKYRLPCAYPQVESADEKAERRYQKASKASLKEALRKLKACK